MRHPILNSYAIAGILVGLFFALTGVREKLDAVNLRLDAAELALAAKIPEPIKFYTIPGYACDTSNIPGHCSNLNITQAEYDKNNSDLFKVTE